MTNQFLPKCSTFNYKDEKLITETFRTPRALVRKVTTYSRSDWDVVINSHEPCNEIPKTRTSSWGLMWEI